MLQFYILFVLLPEELQNQGVQTVFVFCTRGELNKYRVPSLLEVYEQQGFTVHHMPFPDGDAPELERCCQILEELRVSLENNRRTVIQWVKWTNIESGFKETYAWRGGVFHISQSIFLFTQDKNGTENGLRHLRLVYFARESQTGVKRGHKENNAERRDCKSCKLFWFLSSKTTW